jgi:hypothetical protein
MEQLPQEIQPPTEQGGIKLEKEPAKAAPEDAQASIKIEIPRNIQDFVRLVNSGDLVLYNPFLVDLYFQYSKIIRDHSL